MTLTNRPRENVKATPPLSNTSVQRTGLLHAGLLALATITGAANAIAEPVHAIAMHGTPKHPEHFQHFDYVNPNAPKGGRITMAMPGSFDSLNPLIIKGVSAAGLRDFIYESLLVRGRDEPFTLYGQLASHVDVADDRSAITFHLNKEARFSDGHPVDADDLLFSWKILRDKGRPNHRTYYAKVTHAERLSDHSVKFHLDASGDRELPLILGLMPILPSHLLTEQTFEQTTLKPPVGSGPYTITNVDPGRSLTYTRNKQWWGRDLPTNRGRFNFDEIRFVYFRNASARFEAFKSGRADLRVERDPTQWAEGYNIDAVRKGDIIKGIFDISLPAGMSALTFNTRRDVFKDQRVRAALIYVFDFEWTNKNLFHGLYSRTRSYFERSALASTGHPLDDYERVLLAPYLAEIKPDIKNGTFSPPKSDGTGSNRTNWQIALKMLSEAGYALRDGTMINTSTGKPLTFEMLAGNPSQERLFLTFARDLKRLGIAAKIRVVDSSQYQARLKTYDYDMIQSRWPSSLSPGNEQLFRWSSKMVDRDGSYNFPGVNHPGADAMINAMLQTKTAPEFKSAVRALDRILLSGDYVIPLYHLPKQWVAYWRHLAHPKTTSLFGYQLDTWWHLTDAKTQPSK